MDEETFSALYNHPMDGNGKLLLVYFAHGSSSHRPVSRQNSPTCRIFIQYTQQYMCVSMHVQNLVVVVVTSWETYHAFPLQVSFLYYQPFPPCYLANKDSNFLFTISVRVKSKLSFIADEKTLFHPQQILSNWFSWSYSSWHLFRLTSEGSGKEITHYMSQ